MSPRKFTNKILAKAADENPVFFFDFDGTLAEIVPTPEEAGLTQKAKRVIEELGKNFPIGIISGRKLSDLRRLVGINGIYYSGNHGVEIQGPGLKFVEPNSAKSSGYITSLGKKIKRVLRPYRSRVNSKKYSISIHYRTVEPTKVKPLLRDLDKIISGPVRKGRIDVFHGKKVVEIKAPVEWDKGKAIELILKKFGNQGTPIFFGDDTTDEFGFKKVNKMGGISIFVGNKHHSTAAKYEVESPAELVDELAKFVAEMR
ncbi:MAG TPA: trehalose-phosphatase [Candidatus Acidoferrales bacterium]|nr:trehalose-phosphatase [Candidatus Acidoferrales bacterium]